MSKNRFYKDGSDCLEDKEIQKALEMAAKRFENGEILEVRDMLAEIVNAIDRFEKHF